MTLTFKLDRQCTLHSNDNSNMAGERRRNRQNNRER